MRSRECGRWGLGTRLVSCAAVEGPSQAAPLQPPHSPSSITVLSFCYHCVKRFVLHLISVGLSRVNAVSASAKEVLLRNAQRAGYTSSDPLVLENVAVRCL